MRRKCAECGRLERQRSRVINETSPGWYKGKERAQREKKQGEASRFSVRFPVGGYAQNGPNRDVRVCLFYGWGAARQCPEGGAINPGPLRSRTGIVGGGREQDDPRASFARLFASHRTPCTLFRPVMLAQGLPHASCFTPLIRFLFLGLASHPFVSSASKRSPRVTLPRSLALPAGTG